ncbi:prothymosin alpha-like [Marmota marmota marmota]|uniref:prothymosin alpha-like n=1 Tax=Marmota marmota marmota TaxID=9994 RepID=UPI0007625E66|nr:prothymosin alpha-like [Marmota marmota marmota]
MASVPQEEPCTCDAVHMMGTGGSGYMYEPHRLPEQVNLFDPKVSASEHEHTTAHPSQFPSRHFKGNCNHSRYNSEADAALDTSSQITNQDAKEKEEVVEEPENGKGAPANGNVNEENGEQEADNEVDEEEEEGGEKEEKEGEGEEEDGVADEETEAATGKQAAEDGEEDDVDTKKQKTDENDWTAKTES